jgi:hypothetical protein
MNLEETITESKLRNYFRCHYRYYLTQFVGLTKTPITLSAAMVTFFEQRRRRLFKGKNTLFPYQTRVGKYLKPFEDMSQEDLLENLAFASPEDFGRQMLGLWMKMIKSKEIQGRQITFNHNKEPFFCGKRLMAAGTNYYQFILEHGAPFPELIGKQYSLKFEGLSIIVKLPELRRGLVIDDPTIWGFNKDFEEDARSNIATSSLITLRVLAYSSLPMKLKLGIPDDLSPIDPRITYRHINCTTREVQTTSRNESHLDALKKSLDLYLEGTAKENFQPDHSSCHSCPYNCVGLNGKVICTERKPNLRPSVPSYYYKKRAYSSEIKEDGNAITIIGKISNGEIKHQVGALTLEIENENVSATYFSEIRGLDFESRLLREMDQLLQAKATALGISLTCNLTTSHFIGSGIESTKRTLRELGYQNFKKTYPINI